MSAFATKYGPWALIAGSTLTPNFIASKPQDLGMMAPKPLTPEAVAKEAVASLGKRISVTPGFAYRLARFFTGLLPRRQVISLMGDSTRKMYGERTMIINK